MKKTLFFASLALFFVGCKSSQDTSAPSNPPAAGQTGGFASLESDIFGPKCTMCHGENGKAGIDLRSYASVMKGGTEGPIIKPGDVAGSKIIMALKGKGATQMPKNSNPLPAEEIRKVEDWIAAGAKEN